MVEFFFISPLIPVSSLVLFLLGHSLFFRFMTINFIQVLLPTNTSHCSNYCIYHGQFSLKVVGGGRLGNRYLNSKVYRPKTLADKVTASNIDLFSIPLFPPFLSHHTGQLACKQNIYFQTLSVAQYLVNSCIHSIITNITSRRLPPLMSHDHRSLLPNILQHVNLELPTHSTPTCTHQSRP